MKRSNMILESLISKRISEGTDKEVQSDPKKYMDYIVKNYGGVITYGDYNPRWDEAMKHIKKLAKMLKKKDTDLIQDIMREYAGLDESVEPDKLRKFMMNQLAGIYGEDIAKKTDDELKSLMISHFGKNAIKDAEKVISKKV